MNRMLKKGEMVSLATAPARPSREEAEAAVRTLLRWAGDDPDREGLAGTPDRVHRMYAELTAGYHVDPDRLINGAVFDVDYSEMVVVKNIPFYSLCEHHLLPFFGQAAVAYIPRGKVIGLSKIPRVVEMYARRLQVQERLTQQVADFLNERLEPQGVGVVIEANHLCAVMRGIRKPGTIMTTSAVLGLFRSRDRQSMRFAFDLWEHDDVAAHADAILDCLRAGTMPCDGAWPAERVALLERWIREDMPG